MSATLAATRAPGVRIGAAPLLLAPGVLLVLLLFVYPAAYGLVLSFQPMQGGMWENYHHFFTTPRLFGTIMTTLGIALPATLINVGLALPVAYRLRTPFRNRRLLTTILVVPITLGTVLVADGLLSYLGPQGWFNRVLLSLHIVAQPVRLVHNYWGVLMSLVIVGFPFAFLLLLSFVTGIDPSLGNAAATLGAPPGARFRHIALPLLAFGWVVSFALTAGLVAWQGRLLFPALPALAILLAAGIAKANGKRQTANGFDLFTFYLLPFTLAALAIWLPFGVIRPAYPQHTLPEAVALERLGTQVYGRFGVAGEAGAELRGWQLNGPTRAGDTPELALIWHALGRQNRNWTVFVHVIDAQGQIVAEDNRPPQDDAFPMLQWATGDWVEDRHPLALAANLAPGEYHIRVGLFFPRTERRAGVYSKRGTLRGDYLDIGTLTVGS